MVTGDKASFNHTVYTLYNSMSQKMDKGKIELLEVEGVANVLEEKASAVCLLCNYYNKSYLPTWEFVFLSEKLIKRLNEKTMWLN